MGQRYDDDAKEACRQLYLRFNGGQHGRIEAEMRVRWPNWRKTYLYSRGAGKDFRPGWIEAGGWDEDLRIKLAFEARQRFTGAEQLLMDIRQKRESLSKLIDAKKADRHQIYQHRDYCRLEIEALKELSSARNRLQDFLVFWEDLLEMLPELSRNAYRELMICKDDVLKAVEAKYAPN